MPNLIFKRLKYYKKRSLLSSFVYCCLFCALNLLLCLSYSFFSHIYLFSDGFDNDCYYHANTLSEMILDQINKKDCSLIYGLESKVQGTTIYYTGYITPESIGNNNNGLFISERAFFKLDDFKKKGDASDKFAYSTLDINEVTLGDTDYDVLGSLRMTPSWNTANVRKANGFSKAAITLVLDSSKEYLDTIGDGSSIIRGYDNLFADDSFSFPKGSKRNQQVSLAYGSFLPMIYAALLIPFIACAISFTMIISGRQRESTNECAMFRIWGKKLHSSVGLTFGERRLEMIPAFLLCTICFSFAYWFSFRLSFTYILIYSGVELIYAVLIVLFRTISERKKVYLKSGGISL